MSPGGPDDSAAPFTVDARRLRTLPASTVELCGDITAFDARRAEAETRERQDPLYWVDLEVPRGWVLVGDNGQGDEWWLGPRGDVWFFDHVDGERAVSRFAPMHLSITQWLMVGHVLHALEQFDEASDATVERTRAALDAISPELGVRWPYELF
ncbi:hypothetical protein DEU37_1879 [Microbacterium sp. AG790]|uniref:SMI1/KNR4 family protein n=1 Tax=Microbacterium sp. AG790 TaxID=2183995 RepID=UPI000EB15F91|nr:SMI1/KNR4 family protein [Microbacterium sp. AG790]RKS89563.1 hypothetical protein DEU37_1879 [Microbacterium sp. AG790]